MSIQTIVVVGAGTVGRQAAYLAARAGYRTVLEDLSGQRMEEALDGIRRIIAEQMEAGRLPSTEASPLMRRIEVETTLERAGSEADLILEAAPDDLETKIEIYTILDRAAPPRAIFAPAGRIAVAEIASLTYRAPQVVGMRFGAPVVGDGRVEVVRGPETSAAAVAATERLARQMGKEVSVVSESRGNEDGLPEHQAGT